MITLIRIPLGDTALSGAIKVISLAALKSQLWQTSLVNVHGAFNLFPRNSTVDDGANCEFGTGVITSTELDFHWQDGTPTSTTVNKLLHANAAPVVTPP